MARLNEALMENRRWILGDDHHDTFTTMGNLAETCRAKGRWGKAVMLYDGVLEKRRAILDDDHTKRRRSLMGENMGIQTRSHCIQLQSMRI